MTEPATEDVRFSNFIRQIVEADLSAGRHDRIVTRFPPEPNGYLHIGHAKAICVDFGVARDYGGTCNLRYDDTNPTKEDVEYVESIERDVRWLGFAPTAVLFSADYFPKMYELAERLVREGKADKVVAGDEVEARLGANTEMQDRTTQRSSGDPAEGTGIKAVPVRRGGANHHHRCRGRGNQLLTETHLVSPR